MKELKASKSIRLLERFLVDLFNGYFRSAVSRESKSITAKLELETGFLRPARRRSSILSGSIGKDHQVHNRSNA